eukprot:Lithocolla_globosa_v1_NODE_2438_length_2008_cov_2.480799.p2 type:complete len:105 gc:universal NODE_2438_length_2008_cov_2.480799:598-284(-)
MHLHHNLLVIDHPLPGVVYFSHSSTDGLTHSCCIEFRIVFDRIRRNGKKEFGLGGGDGFVVTEFQNDGLSSANATIPRKDVYHCDSLQGGRLASIFITNHHYPG